MPGAQSSWIPALGWVLLILSPNAPTILMTCVSVRLRQQLSQFKEKVSFLFILGVGQVIVNPNRALSPLFVGHILTNLLGTLASRSYHTCICSICIFYHNPWGHLGLCPSFPHFLTVSISWFPLFSDYPSIPFTNKQEPLSLNFHVSKKI